jgi:carboxylate-amine ligase
MRRFGIEEEAMLVDSGTLKPVPIAASLLEQLHLVPGVGDYVSHEFLASQVEYSSPIYSTLGQAQHDLSAFRRELALAATQARVSTWNGGVPFDIHDAPDFTPDIRYGALAEEYRGIAFEHQINALHVHVEVTSRDAGVRALNTARAWLPALLAVSGNSPFWRARDCGFDSWRTIHMRRWTTNGCPPSFVDAADYDSRISRLVGVGGTPDIATVAWNARLSHHQPTVEFRVFDAQLEAWQSVLLAGLCRALVETGASAPWTAGPPAELLDASLWLAARDGISDQLLDPRTGELAEARAVIDGLLAVVGDALHDAGDAEQIQRGIDRVFREGTGARRQRDAFERGGMSALRVLHQGTLGP